MEDKKIHGKYYYILVNKLYIKMHWYKQHIRTYKANSLSFMYHSISYKHKEKRIVLRFNSKVFQQNIIHKYLHYNRSYSFKHKVSKFYSKDYNIEQLDRLKYKLNGLYLINNQFYKHHKQALSYKLNILKYSLHISFHYNIGYSCK